MKLMRYQKGGEHLFWYYRNTEEDVVDLGRFHHGKPCKKWREIFGGKERSAERKAKALFRDFLDTVAKDMIENNNVFVFPSKEMGHMRVGDVSDFVKNYSYNIDTGGKVYGGIVRFRAPNYLNKSYRLKFNRIHGKQINELTTKGKTYW